VSLQGLGAPQPWLGNGNALSRAGVVVVASVGFSVAVTGSQACFFH